MRFFGRVGKYSNHISGITKAEGVISGGHGKCSVLRHWSIHAVQGARSVESPSQKSGNNENSLD